MMAHDDRAVGEELERCDDLRADDGMPAHHRPLLRAEGARLAQHRFRDRDLAQVVQQPGLGDGGGGSGPDAGRERDASRERRDALGMPARVDVLGLERVGQAQQALEARLLQPAVRLAQVDRVLQRLPVGGAHPGLRLLELALPGLRGLVERPEIAGVGQGLGQSYLAGHTEASGTRERTSVSRASGENGLVR